MSDLNNNGLSESASWMSIEQIAPWIAGIGAVGLGAAAVMYQNQSHGKVDTIVPINDQTVQISDNYERVTRQLTDHKLIERPFDDFTTLYDGVRRGARISGDNPCLGYRDETLPDKPYKWISYNQVLERSNNISLGILSKGIKPGQSSMIGIYSANRPEWIIAEFACYNYNMIVVPLYDTLGPDACSYCINQSDMEIIFCDDAKKATQLLKEDVPKLRHVITISFDANDEILKLANDKGISLTRFVQLEQEGSNFSPKPDHTPPKPSDLSTICYTSGTTGTPKGVMLTHGNIVADCCCLFLLKNSTLTVDDVMLSYLPLAHMFERMLEQTCYSLGARVGFFSRDIKLLSDDMKSLRPTVMPTVPRLLNRIFDRIYGEASKSKFKKWLLDWAVSSKEKDLLKGNVCNNGLWDKVVFKRVREGFGGRLKIMITGAAPCSPEVLQFIRAALGCFVLEGYGQTECSAAATCTIEGDHETGHVGPPLVCNMVKLIDVPEMNYLAKNGQGEVCIKGYNVFKGYYKQPKQTAEALDADGWLYTGDIGKWTEKGQLKLIDRKKHIFKLAQGEYIAPEKVENSYQQSRFAAQVYIHGESLKSSLIAFVVPDPDVLIDYAKKHMNKNGSIDELCKDADVKKMILDDMVACGKKSGLLGFEQAREIYLSPEMFSVENGLLTPTFKSKRPALRDYFKDQISELYKNLQ